MLHLDRRRCQDFTDRPSGYLLYGICGITPFELETLAMDRTDWRSSCKSAVEEFSMMYPGVGISTGSAQVWSTIHQQLRVPDLPPDVSFTDLASCPQQVPLVMMRYMSWTEPSIRRSHHHECDLLSARSPIRDRHIRWQIWHSKLLVDGRPDLRRSRLACNS